MQDRIKGLGMGLDLLLKASEGGVQTRAGADLDQAQLYFNLALQEDEKGNFLEAYYYYRRVEDLMDFKLSDEDEKEAWLLSRALNNKASILSENNMEQAACQCLEKALKVCPDNQVARENLNLLNTGK